MALEPTKEVLKDENQDAEENSKIPKASESQEAYAKYMLKFAERNYPKVIGPNGKSIKIKGQFWNLTEIPESTEDEYDRLEKEMNSTALSQNKEKNREAIYNFMTFATSVPKEVLRTVDRGELKILAMIVSMTQQGFRDL